MVLAPRNGVLVVDGYGVKVTVERRHLVVGSGLCDERSFGRFAKAIGRVKRLVVLGHTGFVTLEALRWLHDVGTAFVQIDADGRVIVASGQVGLNDPRLRRTQALATINGCGIEIGRELVRRKLEGQLAVLARLPDDPQAIGAIRQSLASLDGAETNARIRFLEAAAAAGYWKAWERLPVRFVRRDQSRAPDHWQSFGPRGSPLANGPRLAANPANAILNYLYAILEAETRIAILTMGLDPGVGVMHADLPSRDSLALDLMEPVRPPVDAYVLRLLENQVFRTSDFFEDRRGVCRMMPPLTNALCETALHWATRVGPLAEWIAEAFASASDSRIRRLPTLLTESRRSRGRGAMRPGVRSDPRRARLPRLRVCLTCGAGLHSPRHSYCDACRKSLGAERIATFRTAGPEALKRLRGDGRDPAHGGEAGRKRGETNAFHVREAQAWDEHHARPDPAEFVGTILPGLREVSILRMTKATGLSPRYCSLIRGGLRVPHARHWEALRSLCRHQ